MYCRQCGQFLEDNMAFCPRCGTKNGDVKPEVIQVQIVKPKVKRTSVFSVLTIIFSALGFIPLVGWVFLLFFSIPFAVAGLLHTLVGGKKRGGMIASFIVLAISLAWTFALLTSF